jgi:hypothetical protein
MVEWAMPHARGADRRTKAIRAKAVCAEAICNCADAYAIIGPWYRSLVSVVGRAGRAFRAKSRQRRGKCPRPQMGQPRRTHDDCKRGRGADDDSCWPVRILPGPQAAGLAVRSRPAITRSAPAAEPVIGATRPWSKPAAIARHHVRRQQKSTVINK